MIGLLIRIARAVLKMIVQQLMQQFSILEDEVKAPMQKIIQQVTDGIWKGDGAVAFVDEVSSLMIPGVGKVGGDIDFFAKGLQKAEEVMDNADNQASQKLNALGDIFKAICPF